MTSALAHGSEGGQERGPDLKTKEPSVRLQSGHKGCWVITCNLTFKNNLLVHIYCYWRGS